MAHLRSALFVLESGARGSTNSDQPSAPDAQASPFSFAAAEAARLSESRAQGSAAGSSDRPQMSAAAAADGAPEQAVRPVSGSGSGGGKPEPPGLAVARERRTQVRLPHLLHSICGIVHSG